MLKVNNIFLFSAPNSALGTNIKVIVIIWELA